MVGFRETRALLMPFGPVEGVAPGAEIRIAPEAAGVRPTLGWRGRIIDAFGEPIDGKGPLPQGPAAYPLRSPPPAAHARGRVGERLDLGVRAMNVFTTCCRGQRLGVFAGSGVGKSVLLSMLAREAACDAVVVGLIGERGREVREFIEETLGEEGLKRAIVVVATSDEPALKRRQAAYMTLAVAEYLRDQDQEVLCLMDSVTRFAMAQREIGLAAGEPPTTKGYTPTVFTELPKLLERAGPGPGAAGRHGRRADHRPVHRAGRRRRPQRADRRRGARHPRRPHRHGAGDRRARPLPGDQRAEVDQPHHAGLPDAAGARDRDQRAPDAGGLRQHGGADPHRRLSRRLGRRRSTGPSGCNPALEAFLTQDKDEATSLDEGFARLDAHSEG